jgi:hypothetical protein
MYKLKEKSDKNKLKTLQLLWKTIYQNYMTWLNLKDKIEKIVIMEHLEEQEMK